MIIAPEGQNVQAAILPQFLKHGNPEHMQAGLITDR
jgi:hypothetical protein